MSKGSSKDIVLPGDPSIIGPGVWFSIHTLALEADTPEKIDAFIDFMNSLRVKFPCKKCRTHINEYLDNHSIELFRKLKDKDNNYIGMFKYSWMFHNAVNTRLGKPYVDYDTAKGMYENPAITVCNIGCDDHDDHNDVGPIVSKGGPTTKTTTNTNNKITMAHYD